MFSNIKRMIVHHREIRKISCVIVNMTNKFPYVCSIKYKNGERVDFCDIPDIARYFIYKAHHIDSEVRYDSENDIPYCVRCYYII